ALIDLGFEDVGMWRLDNGQLRYTLTQHATDSRILYAFVVDESVLYIGKSVRQLTHRMYNYQNPGPSQKTNIVNTQRLTEEMAQRPCVQIWVLVIREPMFYCGWPVNVEDGLEEI